MKKIYTINKKGFVVVEQYKVLEFLEQEGFSNIKIKNQWYLARIKDNIVDLVHDTFEVRKYLIDYIKSNCNESFKNQVIEKILGLFKYVKRTGLIDGLQEIELKLLTGDTNTTYKFFRNVALKITTSGFEPIEYGKLTGHVFRSAIINKEFSLVEDELVWGSDFPKFLFRCMMMDESNYFELIKILGYLSSSYKSIKDNKAVVLCDDDFDDVPEGGTGKSLTALALSHFNNTVIEDGKNFVFTHFTFQQVENGTQLLIIDDATKKLDFESLFSSITSGFQIEKKYQDKYKLELNESPKILITTNYTIFGQGFSFERRILEVEFSHYYGRNKSPLDEFQSEFFISWNENEWNLFYNFMVRCVQSYHKAGVNAGILKDSVKKRLRRQTSLEFYEFIVDYKLEGWIIKRVLFDKFIQEFPNMLRWVTIRKFNSWIRIFCSTMKIEFIESKMDGGQRCWVF